jgi:hypothetical protein
MASAPCYLPDRPVGHSRVQTLIVGDNGLIRRFDYEIDIAGAAPGAHLLGEYTDVEEIMVPRQHIIFARDDKDKIQPVPLMVSIDVDQIEFDER